MIVPSSPPETSMDSLIQSDRTPLVWGSGIVIFLAVLSNTQMVPFLNPIAYKVKHGLDATTNTPSFGNSTPSTDLLTRKAGSLLLRNLLHCKRQDKKSNLPYSCVGSLANLRANSRRMPLINTTFRNCNDADPSYNMCRQSGDTFVKCARLQSLRLSHHMRSMWLHWIYIATSINQFTVWPRKLVTREFPSLERLFPTVVPKQPLGAIMKSGIEPSNIYFFQFL